ncbi:MAG TPA: glycosyltransferase family 4 protein [Crinalium sp.]|jgi:glycosyltransferase involved in cell wall biosynthesis
MTKALVAIDADVFYQGPDGRVYTQSVATYDDYWTIPRSSFDQLIVVTRFLKLDELDDSWSFADGDGVTFQFVPFYRGPIQFFSALNRIRAVLEAALEDCDVLLCNGPGNISAVGIDLAQKMNKLYAIDVTTDPYDVFAPGAFKHPLRPLFRQWISRRLQHQCKNACAINYVTKHALQCHYPPPSNALTAGISAVNLPDEAFVSSPRCFQQKVDRFTLITVGTLAQLYKAPDILIEAVAICILEGLDLELILIGDGKHREELEVRVNELGLQKRVFFQGQLPAGAAIRQQLDKADLFVLPSYQEGLPKAMVEAMARALPCIGSTVGGIPELLPSEDLVPPGNVNALAKKIREIVTDVDRMNQMSTRNLEKSKEYKREIIREQRIRFFRGINRRVIEHLKDKKQNVQAIDFELRNSTKL